MGKPVGNRIRKYRWLLVFFLIVGLGTFLRVLHLGKECLWLDEAISYHRGLMSLSSIIRASYGWDVHPPTYYLIVHFITQLGKSEATLRLFSAVCGILAIPVFYQLGRQMMGKREAFISAFLLAISVFHIRFSQEARVYSLFFLISLFSILFFYKAFTRQDKRDWLLWAGISLIHFYIHYFSLVLLGAEVLFYVFYELFQKTTRGSLRHHRWFFLASLFVLVGCVPQIFFFLGQIASKINASTQLQSFDPIQFVLVFLKNVTNPVELSNPLLERSLKYLVGAFVFLGILLGWSKYKDVILFNGAIISFALLLAWISSLFIYFSGSFRYIIFLNAPFLLLLSLAITAVVDGVVDRFARLFPRFVQKEGRALGKLKHIEMLVILVMFSTLHLYVLVHYYHHSQKPDWRTGISHLVENYRENDLIVPIPDYADHVPRYYLALYRVRPRVMRINNLSYAVMDSLVSEHPNVFFVTDGPLPTFMPREKIDEWLDQKARLIWQDPHFPGSAIWFTSSRSLSRFRGM